MKNSKNARNHASQADPLEPRHLDLSKAVRGKYYDRMQAGNQYRPHRTRPARQLPRLRVRQRGPARPEEDRHPLRPLRAPHPQTASATQ